MVVVRGVSCIYSQWSYNFLICLFFLSVLFDLSLSSMFSNFQDTKSVTYFYSPMNVMYMSKTQSLHESELENILPT